MTMRQKGIQLDKTQKELILLNLDNDGRLSCLKAFKVARLIGLRRVEMTSACESIGIKISNCEYNIFGRIRFQNAENATYSKIAQNFTQDKYKSCKTLWYMEQESSLKRVNSTIKYSDVETAKSELTCFRERKANREIKN